MRIGVTGAAGFIGVNLTKYFMSIGHNLVMIDNFAERFSKRRVRALGLEEYCLKLDINDFEALLDAFRDVDAIIHLAAESNVDHSLLTPLQTVESNSLGTATVLEVARSLNVRVVYVSTDEVFGDLDLDSSTSFTEDSPISPSSPYSASKASGDLLALAWFRSFNLDVSITNCGNNYGRFQSPTKLIPKTMKLIRSNSAPEIFGSGKNVRDWIHVEDHCSAINLVLEKGEPGKRYLVGLNDTMANDELVTEIIKCSPSPFIKPKYIEDRLGHDRKYAIEPSLSLQNMGWSAKHSSLKQSLPQMWNDFILDEEVFEF